MPLAYTKDFNKRFGYGWEKPMYDRKSKIISKTAVFDTLSHCILTSDQSDLDYTENIYALAIGMASSKMLAEKGAIIGGSIPL